MARDSEAHPSRARLFVALELPAAVRQQLRAWADDIAERAGHSLRAVAPENLHVTLCFLGHQPAADIPAIAAACQAAVSAATVALELGDATWLPPRRPRVLAVQLVDVARVLAPLQGRLSGALAAGGWYEPERRAYLPHVTVARVPGEGRVRGREPPALPRMGPFSGASVTLMRSHLGGGGARYEAVWTLPLG